MSQKLHDRLMTGLEVARVYGVSPDTIRKWARAGKLTAVRLSARCIRYKQTDVERLLAAGESRGEAARG